MDILGQSKHRSMDDPKTRRETKKTAKEKKGEKYGQKHVRAVAARKPNQK
jgi:hypothetical protein